MNSGSNDTDAGFFTMPVIIGIACAAALVVCIPLGYGVYKYSQRGYVDIPQIEPSDNFDGNAVVVGAA